MTKKQINLYLTKLDWLFGLQHFDKKIIIKEKDEDEKAAEIITDIPYQLINVYIYPCFFKEEEKDQKKMLVHELCHTITAQHKLSTYDILDGKFIPKKRINEINEEATSKIENIIWGFLNKNFDSFIKELKK